MMAALSIFADIRLILESDELREEHEGCRSARPVAVFRDIDLGFNHRLIGVFCPVAVHEPDLIRVLFKRPRFPEIRKGRLFALGFPS